jgi:hypothetical protein
MVLAVPLLMLLASIVYAQDSQKTDYGWLNGKWSGRPPAGGSLEMTLRVEGDQIRGTGVIPGPARGRGLPDVSGRIEGDNITISTYFPKTQTTVTYHCTAAEGDLHCKTKNGYETVFKKFRD